MVKFFICYRRADNVNNIVNDIYKYLGKKFGKKNVFMDLQIPLGKDYRGVLREVTSQCDVMIVIIGVNWQVERLNDPSDWVRFEIETGLQRHNVRVIPLLLNGVSLPKKEILPESIQGLTVRQSFEMKDDRSFIKNMKQFVHWLKIKKTIDWKWIIGAILVPVLIALFNMNDNDLPIPPTATSEVTVTPMPTLEATVTPTFTPEVTATDSIDTWLEVTVELDWIRLRILSDQPISLSGLELRPVQTSSAGIPVRDFDVLIESLAQPQYCYIYRRYQLTDISLVGCERAYYVSSLFWRDLNSQPRTVQIFWQEQFITDCAIGSTCEVFHR
jgi:hypothetical protein